MLRPDITIRSTKNPYVILSSLPFVQTKDMLAFPVNQGENSDYVDFRVYNNYAVNTGIANATSVRITSYDSFVLPLSTITLPVTQRWLRIFQTGYGEGAAAPGSLYDIDYTLDTPFGSGSYYYPEHASDLGDVTATIRAGSDNNGCGFMQFRCYLSLPDIVPLTVVYNPIIVVSFSWSP